MEYNAVKVELSNSNRKHFFSINDLNLKTNDFVIVETEKGNQFGKICGEAITIDEKASAKPLNKIIRKATLKDIKQNDQNKKTATEALKKAKEISKKLKLDMIFLNSYFTFDRTQLVLNFMAEDRIDFRELAKTLASIYKTRIELRQIGVRDKAKEVGGLGPCGRFLCCNLFLNEFESVSINMAKNQYISLKPDKINGICGRLLCCLNYEDKQYTEAKKKFPTIGSTINYNNMKLKVISHNIFNRTFVAENSEKTTINIGLDEYESNK